MKATARKMARSLSDRAVKIHKINPLIFPALIVLFFILSSLQEIAEEMLEGDTHTIDMQILNALRDPADQSNPIGPHWLEELMRDYSALGGIGILAFVTIAATTYLFVTKKTFQAWFLLAAVTSGTLLTNILKAGFDRPRPDLMPHDTFTFTASFPSGHSMMAALVYLTLGSLLAQNQPSQKMRIFIMSIAVFMAVMVGISRVYLGAHWASDVLAGWLAGSAWALIFWLGEKYLLSRQR